MCVRRDVVSVFIDETICYVAGGNMSEKLVDCKGVSVTLGGRLIMQELNLSINRGDFVMVVGSNGSGKST